jgi:hypothetical protein
MTKPKYPPGTAPNRRRPVEERFWEKVDKNGPIPTHRPELGPCWVWIGSCDTGGYGLIRIGRKVEKAHRYAYMRDHGPLEHGIQVLHHCDNTACCRTAHHFTGTLQDNMRDRNAKGRQAKLEQQGRARLTRERVRVARKKHGTGEATIAQLARDNRVGFTTMKMAIKGETWKDI